MSLLNSVYSIGMSGEFCFKEPFDTFFKDRSDVLTINSLTTLGELYSNNVDPYILYYAPYGVSDADFKKSVSNNDLIIGFKNTLDTWYYVPSSYIVSIPNTNGSSYQITGISINLGAIKKDLDLSSLITSLSNQVQGVLGIKAKIERTVMSSERLIDIDTSKKIEAARDAVKTDIMTTFQLQNMLINARNQIRQLESFIICNGCGDGGTVFNSVTNTDCNGNYVLVTKSVDTVIPDTLAGTDCDAPSLDAGDIFISDNKISNGE